MPATKTNALSAAFVKKVAAPGTYADGLGLTLRVDDKGNKKWVQRITIDGKQRNIGLGGYPATGLADARTVAQDNHRAIREGRNPVEEKRQAKESAKEDTTSPAPATPMFADVAAQVIELRRPTWSNAKHAAQWTATLETYAFPTIGDKAIDAITAADVLAVLTPIWTEKPETASRVRQRIEAVLDFAVANGWRADNPAGRHLLKVLPDTKGLKEHHRALPYADVAAALRKVRLSPSHTLTRLAFAFMVYTAARAGEVRHAEWSEIDFESATWIVPATRMKARKEHRVPLSNKALELLQDAKDLTGGEGLVFPAKRSGEALTDMAFNTLLRRLEIDAVPHGFRSSFRDWAAECSGASKEVCELSLAHNSGNAVEMACMRSDLFELRRSLMQQWADYLAG